MPQRAARHGICQPRDRVCQEQGAPCTTDDELSDLESGKGQAGLSGGCFPVLSDEFLAYHLKFSLRKFYLDVNCDLHIHSNISDGLNDLSDVFRDIEAMQLDLAAICDHYPQVIQKGLNNYLSGLAYYRKVSSARVLSGVEVHIINREGEVELKTDERPFFDIILAELMGGLVFNPKDTAWSRERTDKNCLIETVFTTYLNACRNPLIDVIAHPFNLGRMAKSYPFSLKDLPRSLLLELARAMAKYKKAFEICSQFYLWYPAVAVAEFVIQHAELVSLFASEGVKFTVATDAHSCGTIGNLRWARAVIKTAGLADEWRKWLFTGNAVI